MGENHTVYVVRAGVSNTREDALLGFNLCLHHGHVSIVLMRDLDQGGRDALQPLLMRLVQQPLVQYEVLALASDDVLFFHCLTLSSSRLGTLNICSNST